MRAADSSGQVIPIHDGKTIEVLHPSALTGSAYCRTGSALITNQMEQVEQTLAGNGFSIKRILQQVKVSSFFTKTFAGVGLSRLEEHSGNGFLNC